MIDSNPTPLKRLGAALLTTLLVSLALVPGSASADEPTVFHFDDEAAFIFFGGGEATITWENPGAYNTYWQNDVAVLAPWSGHRVHVRDWVAEREGFEMAPDGHDSAWFYFPEPQTGFGLNIYDSSVMDSKWQVRFFMEGVEFYSSEIDGTLDTMAFDGFLFTDATFDRVLVWETTTAVNEDDFYGTVYTAVASAPVPVTVPPLPPIPELPVLPEIPPL